MLVGQLLVTEAVDVGFDASRTDELVAIVAEHAGLDPARDLRPAVVVAAMMGAAQAAFRAWVKSGGTVELSTMVSDALGAVGRGLHRIVY